MAASVRAAALCISSSWWSSSSLLPTSGTMMCGCTDTPSEATAAAASKMARAWTGKETINGEGKKAKMGQLRSAEKINGTPSEATPLAASRCGQGLWGWIERDHWSNSRSSETVRELAAAAAARSCAKHHTNCPYMLAPTPRS